MFGSRLSIILLCVLVFIAVAIEGAPQTKKRTKAVAAKKRGGRQMALVGGSGKKGKGRKGRGIKRNPEEGELGEGGSGEPEPPIEPEEPTGAVCPQISVAKNGCQRFQKEACADKPNLFQADPKIYQKCLQSYCRSFEQRCQMLEVIATACGNQDSMSQLNGHQCDKVMKQPNGKWAKKPKTGGKRAAPKPKRTLKAATKGKGAKKAKSG